MKVTNYDIYEQLVSGQMKLKRYASSQPVSTDCVLASNLIVGLTDYPSAQLA
jgi:hypothetical protein